jgi:hypothetical protein
MGDRALHPEQLKVKIEELKVIRTPAGNFELLTFNSQLGKLGIAPPYPIGYNGGRSSGRRAECTGMAGMRKASACVDTGLRRMI